MSAAERGLTNTWMKSSKSYSNGDCVEAKRTATGAAVRDSKDPKGPVLGFKKESWRTFTTALKGGQLRG